MEITSNLEQFLKAQELNKQTVQHLQAQSSSVAPSVNDSYNAPVWDDPNKYIETTLDDAVFGDSSQSKKPTSRDEIEKQSQEIVAELQARGLKTTGINYASDEVTFVEYAAAVSDELKAEVMKAFEENPEVALEMQRQIAGLFAQHNAVGNTEFMRLVSQLGYKIERESVRTSHIKDDKSSAADHGTLKEGYITTFTITDPETGVQLKILDTNGNGFIEVEEVFMNEFLSGLSVQLDSANYLGSDNRGVQLSGQISQYLDSSGDIYDAETSNEIKEQQNKEKISAQEYERIKEEYKNKLIEQRGYTESNAILVANQYMQAHYSKE